MINNKIILNPIMHNGDILTIALSADENVKIKALKYNKFMMNCPYHNDRHPSFILDRNKNTFKCLSTNCSKKGNLEQYKNLIDESNQKTLLYKLNSVNKYHN